MARRQASFALVIPVLVAACGDDTRTPLSSGGSSNVGVSAGLAGAHSGGATGLGGAAGALLGGSGNSAGGVSGKASLGGSTSLGNGGTSEGTSAGGTRAGLGGGASGGASGKGSTSSGANSGGSAGDRSAGGSVSGASAVGGSTGGTGEAQGQGSGGKGGAWSAGEGIPGPNFATIKYMFNEVPCYGSNCHNSPRNHFQVQKSDDELYKYMMSFTTLECGKLIDKAKPAESALVKYLRGPCGSIERMPPGWCVNEGDEWCLPENLIQAVEDWIAAGAPR